MVVIVMDVVIVVVMCWLSSLGTVIDEVLSVPHVF